MFARIAGAGAALALIALGAGALAAPGAASRGYGIDSSDPDSLAFIRAMGARDVTLGSILALATLRGDRASVRATLGSCVIVGLADFGLVAMRRGAVPQLVVHGAGVVGLIVAVAGILPD